MSLRKLVLSTALLVMIASVVVSAQPLRNGVAAQWAPAKRVTLAIKYADNEGFAVDMAGTGLHSNVTGRAEAKRSGGRTRIKLRVNNLQHPQTLGPYCTSYIVWAITPEGHTNNLGGIEEMPQTGAHSREIEVNIPHQTFGLIITAEPHALVRHPGPAIIAENVLRKNTKGNFSASNIEYYGDSGIFYTASGAAAAADYDTPPVVLGARRAVEIARRAGARTYASEELRSAENKLAMTELIWLDKRKRTEKLNGDAREAIRLAEAARAKAIEQTEQAQSDTGRGTYQNNRPAPAQEGVEDRGESIERDEQPPVDLQ